MSTVWKRGLSLCLLLVVLLSCANIHAFADDDAAQQSASTVLSQIRIKDLDVPVADVPFDTLVTAEAEAEELSWEIPLYWVDGDGEDVPLSIETPEDLDLAA